MGGGNVCSIEFNLLYRWHAAVSEPDAEWIRNELTAILGKDPAVVCMLSVLFYLHALRLL